MKALQTLLVFSLLLVACNKLNSSKLPPVNAVNRQQNSANCPKAWNGPYQGQTTKRYRILKSGANTKNIFVINDNDKDYWSVDGQAHRRDSNRTQSYTAICGSFPLIADASTSGNGIDIQIFSDGKQIASIRYVENDSADASGTAYDYSATDSTNQPLEASETYKLMH